ncbi:type II toxin-antitoxin system VapB family antitoxin [Rhizobium lentis]|uniref:Type II toxin-antitoxin system VapB family antitoxin n=1 Tax=Rhizobium lentis TaxID=1138194 RepID=A0A9Q3QYQ7_9HYPH|nr:type II toxin-antitoxin system VapB family antitoxin [Rhizobium lentis]MBX4955544.1 type II toxin-antitoxin system VapB family antitoxin [Rhizobium lentis]MBX4973548.1 type II toxin-antitoxin system VapB family antitoxin [Rhizobium lentis]MBX4984853.1 type II toxin-antitoxin system VapB family antitoxin [Rhizobium lentis]MBX5003298.1 type II toxin-antitoxin system VapB family antitoxin [Rhizobium lentis]MBX5022282.1 type II toxin-antitoxin system VapB family antitoxin [Rhizobium lentis]
MALYIRDPEVDELAKELQRLTKAATKTDAVRTALHHELTRARQSQPLHERLARAKSLADAMGANDPSFDMKKFSDEMWDT